MFFLHFSSIITYVPFSIIRSIMAGGNSALRYVRSAGVTGHAAGGSALNGFFDFSTMDTNCRSGIENFSKG